MSRSCEQCDAVLVGGRADRRYCDANCRQAARRARNRQELTPLAGLAVEADRQPAPHAQPLSEADLVELLEVQAKRGSVRAVELLLRRVSRMTPTVDDGDPFRELDEIAAGRRARLGRAQ